MVATPVDSIWTSKDIVTAVVATGLVTAAASWCVDLIKTWWSKRNIARYLAMRCATELERYAVDCWHVIHYGAWRVSGAPRHHRRFPATGS